jgi:GTP-binding protein Era
MWSAKASGLFYWALKGERIKKVGHGGQTGYGKFFGKKVFLEQFIKVEADWRKDSNKLKGFGY